jgi:BirA family biotin operon repressor/biotin-[acetyl-CoA-carboxylase] ligase
VTEIRHYETLDSTNEEARRIAAAGAHGPLWIVAERQSAGRGRRGRAWVSEPGNLFATYFDEVDAPLDVCAQASLVAGLAVADVVAGYAPNAEVTLKWPNDVLLEKRKVAGILLESAPNGGLVRLVVGIGINLSNHPAGTEFPATSLRTESDAPTPAEAFVRLAAAWDAWYDAWRSDGFATIRAAWLARAAGRGEKLAVRLGDSETIGVFDDMDDSGALLLRLGDGSRLRVTAGEVFFGL